MAIIQYQSEAKVTLWKAYVSVRSKTNPSIRIQRWKFGIESEKQALREESSLLTECQAEVFKRETQGATWGNLVSSWEAFLSKDPSVRISEVTRSDYVAAIRKHTESWLKRDASGITRADVLEMLMQLKEHDLTLNYQNKIKAIVNKIFNYGIDFRLIKGMETSPASRICLGKEEDKKPEILTIEQIKTLLIESKRLNHPWFPIWAMAVLTGMRNGELYALLWSDVDFANREITVSKSYNCRRRIVKTTKGDYWRTVPISAQLKDLLEELRKQTGDQPEVLPRLYRWYQGEQAKTLRGFCEGIGLPSVKFHTLRACFATQLIRNAVPPIQLQKICGWRDLDTMQRYIRLAGIETKGATESLHVLPDMLAIEKAGEFFSNKTEMSSLKETSQGTSVA